MQQEASRKLSFTLKRQCLLHKDYMKVYMLVKKGTVGLITYMRTDSTRISDEARAVAKRSYYSKIWRKLL